MGSFCRNDGDRTVYLFLGLRCHPTQCAQGIGLRDRIQVLRVVLARMDF